ncbi:ATPase H+ transporting accessory protein 1 like a isoform X1 [Syngnathus scovelli]|uniref:ATPase H+ transporting accessory protein 1 like a isoform X1 n=2 Tax=Syngnathus scovelli TaxID=161590 RepID=UPI00210F59AF|nr:ATPase H+ transporting accessory protein 1 like a isoform X1 [Syngnathus scovelli]
MFTDTCITAHRHGTTMAPKSPESSRHSILLLLRLAVLLLQPSSSSLSSSSSRDPHPSDSAAAVPVHGADGMVIVDGQLRTEESLTLHEVTKGRKLLQTPGAALPFPPLKVLSNGRPCMMFQARRLYLRYKRQKQVDLTEQAFSPQKSVDISQSVCRQDRATLVMRFGDVDDLRGLSIRMQLSNTFYEASGQWWFSLDSVSVVYNTSQEAVFNASEVYAPSSSSYHCSHVSSLERHSALLKPGSDNARCWTLTFTDFQIQAFNVTSGRFSPASDCTTFLTPAILMGLVTSLILLLVLAYALHLLVHLNRIENDRERKAHGDFLRSPEQMERCCAENVADKDVP